jgi:hypothetical protein
MDLAAWAGIFISCAAIWRLAVWPGLRAIWAAILAAPKIADGTRELVQLIEGDVMGKLEEMNQSFTEHESKATVRDQRLDAHTLQLENHELRITQLEKRE